MTVAGVIALIIFVGMFVFIVLDKIERHYVTLGCGLLTLGLVFGIVMHSGRAILETLNLKSMTALSFWYSKNALEESMTGINWATILFVLGMMIMVEGMASAGFFRWLCMTLAKMVHYQAIPLFVVFMIMSAILAMFIDSITVVLFLAAVTIELSALLEFDPVPMILSEIFCANLGGSASMCGDPPNIIIGTSLRYSFGDFVKNTGVLAGICLIFVVIYFLLVFRKDLSTNVTKNIDAASMPEPKTAIKNKRDFFISSIIFALAVVLLVTHATTGLTVAFIGVFIAIITLLTAGRGALELLKKVDYKTLLFFIGLFIVVGGLEETGVLESIAAYIGEVSQGNVRLMIAIIIWVSAIASAFVDNIPFAATMVPVIQNLAATQGVDVSTLAWTLSMGADIGGSATPIGASANVVGISVAAKNGHFIGWGRYCKVCAPITIFVIGISMLLIFARYC